MRTVGLFEAKQKLERPDSCPGSRPARNQLKRCFSGYRTDSKTRQADPKRGRENKGWPHLNGFVLDGFVAFAGANLHVVYNFSSTYNESSIMRSTNCSAGSPAKFLSTNSLT